MPGDRLALAVFVRREQELVDVLELRLQIGDDLLLPRVDDVERLEVVVDVDAEARPGLSLSFAGTLGRVVRAGRGCGRSTTRRRSPCRDSPRSSSPWQATRRSRACGPSLAAISRATLAPWPESAILADRGTSPEALPALPPDRRRFLAARCGSASAIGPTTSEHLPASGGYVLAAGHVSNLDPWALGAGPVATAVSPLHGQVGALLVAARRRSSRPAAPSRCAGGARTSRRSRRPSGSPGTAT